MGGLVPAGWSRAVAVLVFAASIAGACSASKPASTAAPVQPVVYVAVGASETRGVGASDPVTEAWPSVFRHTALPQNAVFENLGILGATTEVALKREVPHAVELNPTIVTVWLNVNDIVAGVGAADYERELGDLVHALRRGGATRVLVANVPALDELPVYKACQPGGSGCRIPVPLPGPDVVDKEVDAYNAAITAVATREGAVVVDLHSLSLAARNAGTEQPLISGDGFHPSTAGHAAVAAAFAEALRRSGPLVPGS